MKQDHSIKNTLALNPYKKAISRYIRSAMVLKNKRYEDLVGDLAEKGIHITSDNLRSKVSKGMFSADLFVAIIESLKVETVALEDILKLTGETHFS